MKPLILGSSSPRRSEILRFFSIPFRQENPIFDETTVPYKGDPAAFVKEIAERKALSLLETHPDELILSADTVVSLEGRIFQKPENLMEAKAMLFELSHKKHTVYTGVCIQKKEKQFSGVETSLVEFNELTEAQVDSYIKAFHPLDKAGGYGIQKGGSLIVKRIEGCYYNIMGLPIQKVRELLLKAGIDLWDFLNV